MEIIIDMNVTGVTIFGIRHLKNLKHAHRLNASLHTGTKKGSDKTVIHNLRLTLTYFLPHLVSYLQSVQWFQD